eukprot:s6248_g3.t1
MTVMLDRLPSSARLSTFSDVPIAVAMAELKRPSDSFGGAPPKVAKNGTQLVKISYALSGKHLTEVFAAPQWTVGQLRMEIQKRMPRLGEVVQSVLKDDHQLRENKMLSEVLSETELVDGMTLCAIVTLDAALCLFAPCRAKDVSDMACVQDMNKLFLDMSSAPPTARDLAVAMKNAAPDLGGIQIVGGSNESCDGGQVFVIANPGDSAVTACLRALAIEKQDKADWVRASDAASEDECCENSSDDFAAGGQSGHWEAAEINPWHICPEDFREDEFDEPNESISNQLKDISRLMAENLKNGFRFQFQDEVVRSPVIYGGYCSDGSIVGVLSSRVYT